MARLLRPLLLLLASQAFAWDFNGAAEVKQFLAENEDALLAFVAPKTESSKSLLPEWKTVQQSGKLNTNGINVVAKSVDCAVARDLCRDMDVASFPAIRLYHQNRSAIRYRGPRKAEAIISFVQRVSRPAVSKLVTQDIASFSSSDDIVFIAHLGQEKDENDVGSLSQRMKVLANEYHDRFSFGVTQGPPGESTPSNVGSISCYNNLDGSRHDTAEIYSVDALKKTLDACTTLLVPQLTRRNEMKYISTGKSIVYYFSDDAQDRDAYTRDIKPVARAYKEYLQLVTVDSSEYPDMARGMGISSKHGLAVRNPHNGQVFPLPDSGYGSNGRISADAVSRFIVSISEGKVQPWGGRFATDEGSAASKAGHDEL